MYELKKIGKEFTSKFVGTVPSSYKKRIYRTAVSHRLRNTGIKHNGNDETEANRRFIYHLYQVVLSDMELYFLPKLSLHILDTCG
jgi:hypothetical protein